MYDTIGQKEATSMSIKKRIFLLNMSMILIALLVLFLVTIGFTKYSAARYSNHRFISDLDNNAILVKESIESLESNFVSWEALSEEMKAHQYEIVVAKDDKVIFQTIGGNVESHLEMVSGRSKQGIHTIWGITYVDGFAQIGDETYYVVALQQMSSNKIEEERNTIFSGFFSSIVILSTITITILLFLAWLFSRHLLENITRPLEELTKGAKRIADGNLEEAILYKGYSEMESVCNTFNAMQEDVRKHEEERKRYEQARTDMVTSISHDLRTPLTSIKGYIKGILDGVAHTREKQEQYLRVAYETTEEMDILLQKLFLFSKIETGKMPLDQMNINLPEYMNQYVGNREKQYQNKGLEIRYVMSESSFEGSYDIVQMQRVFDNLLENSLTYANRELVVVDIKISENDEEEIVTFRDNGNGVPYEKLPHIFERFYRCDEARGTEGIGVGLYIVKYIVEAHGGYVIAENQNGLSIAMHFPKRRE